MKLDSNLNQQQTFLYPVSDYHGQVKEEQELVFHDRLEQFAHQVTYLSGLHSNGKLSAEKVSQLLDNYWQSLNIAKYNAQKKGKN